MVQFVTAVRRNYEVVCLLSPLVMTHASYQM